MLTLKDRINYTATHGLTIRAYKAADIEAMTGIPQGTLAQWRFDGRGPRYIHVEGKIVRYPAEDFETWWRRQEEASR